MGIVKLSGGGKTVLCNESFALSPSLKKNSDVVFALDLVRPVDGLSGQGLGLRVELLSLN